MISEHDEIEAKMCADGTSFDDFKAFVMNKTVERYDHIVGPDLYYESGVNVVRHRQDRKDNRHELTVKKRKSDGSTRDRMEVDLHFGKKTVPADVDAFLRGIGFTHVMTLVKEAHIFWVRLSPNLIATYVIYDVWRDEDPETKSRFIEVEAEKGSDVTVDTAKRHLRTAVTEIRGRFKVPEPLNESLWEIYSGKRYSKV
jgi:adenylate cyclase class IV